MSFLIQLENGIFKLTKLDYKNIIFNKTLKFKDEIFCLRIPRNNNDIGIDNEKYNELIKRYEVENIIKVSRKEKIKEIIYSLNREINYSLFIHSKFIKQSAFEIKDKSIF